MEITKSTDHNKRFQRWLTRGLLFCVIITFLLPFTPVVLGSVDLQPLAPVLVFGLFIVSFGKLRVRPWDSLWLITGTLIAAINLFFQNGFVDIRINLAFITFAIFYIMGFNIFRIITPDLMFKVLNLVLIFWVAVIFMQFLGMDMSILSPNRTTSGRGVTGIAPEPTFAALQLFCCLPLLIVLKDLGFCSSRRFKLIIILIFALSFLVHLSATAFMITGLAVGLSVIMRLDIKKILSILAALLAICFFGVVLFLTEMKLFEDALNPILVFIGLADVRFVKLIEVALSGSLLLDASAFDRLVSSFKFLFSPYFLPFPRTHAAWIADVNQFINSSFFNIGKTVNYEYRNLSGLGQINFILGSLFFIPLLGLFRKIKSSHNLELLCLNCFFISLLFSLPIANPMVGLSLGLLSSYTRLCEFYKDKNVATPKTPQKTYSPALQAE